MTRTATASQKISGRGSGILYAVPAAADLRRMRLIEARSVSPSPITGARRPMSRKSHRNTVPTTSRKLRGPVARLYRALTRRWPTLGVTGAEILLAACVGIGWGIVLSERFVFAFG